MVNRWNQWDGVSVIEALSLDVALEMFANSLVEERIKHFVETISILEDRIEVLEVKNRKNYLKQQEVISEFGIGHRTLKKWVDDGLKEIWLGNRVYYDQADIESYMQKIKTSIA